MVFANRLVVQITLAFMAALLLVLISGAMALRAFGGHHQQRELETVTRLIDQHLEQLESTRSANGWLTGLLETNGVRTMDLRVGEESLLSYREADAASHFDDPLEYRFTLPNHADHQVYFEVSPWFMPLHFGPGHWGWLGLGLGSSLLILCWLTARLKRQQIRTDNLAWRAALILKGHYHRAHLARGQEWPEPVAGALDRLLHEVDQLRRERSRFDNFIRSSAFVDPLTGVGNQEYFVNRLEVAVGDKSDESGGYVLVLGLTELDWIRQQSGGAWSDELLVLTGELLGYLIKRIEGATIARYAPNRFALLLPHSDVEAATDLARQLLRVLRRLRLPKYIDDESFFYIGGVAYRPGQPADELINLAEEALRVARLQGPSGWHFQRHEGTGAVIQRGSVRWRLLLERVLEQRQLVIFYQPIVDSRDRAKWYLELLPRIRDEQGLLLNANTFLPMVDKVGMLQRLDRYMVEEMIGRLRGGSKYPLSVNLSLDTLASSRMRTWLNHELMQLPLILRRKVVFEVAEGIVSQHLGGVRQTLLLFHGLGCRVAVDHAGKDVVSTHYVVDLKLDYLKVHPSLVRDLHLRPVNQLAIRSLMGGCVNTATKLVAVGVETEEEWLMLRQLGVEAAQGFYFSAPRDISVPRRRRQKTV